MGDFEILAKFQFSYYRIPVFSLYRAMLKPQDSFSEFDNFFFDLQKVQEIIRKHHQIFLNCLEYDIL